MSSIKPATFQVRFDPDVLKRTDWKAALEGCKSTDELHAEKHLQGLQKRATADGDVQVAAFWEALSAILSLSLNLTDRATPLHAQYTTPEWQTASLENFPPETLRSFGDLLIGNIPPVIAARLADAIWSRLRVHQHGRRAVKEYIALAENGLASGRSVWAIPRIIRAARISAELDPNGSLYDETMARVENWLAESVEQTDEHHVALSLLDLVHDQRWGNDYLKWADISKRLAMAESKCSRYDFARQFWEMEVRFCERVEDQTERVRSGRIAIAESYEKQAEIGTHGQKAHWLTKAIEAWRRVGGSREKVDILLSSLKQEQKLALGEMGEIQTPFDATEILESGRTCVRGKSGLDAILALGIALSPPHRSELEVSVKEDLNRSPFLMLMGRAHPTPEGNVAARIPSLDLSEDDNAEWLNSYVLLKYAEHQSFVSGTFIEAARRELTSSCVVSNHDWNEFTANNPFIPPGREQTFARGLEAGMVGDFPLCAHFLIPQIENSIRQVVERAGGIVTYAAGNEPGIQREVDLNQLLCDTKFSAKTIEVFGEDHVLDMRALLVDGGGPNLRNRLCHGLVDYDAFFSRGVVYLWWLTIHLCTLGHLLVHRREEMSTDNHTTPPPEQ